MRGAGASPQPQSCPRPLGGVRCCGAEARVRLPHLSGSEAWPPPACVLGSPRPPEQWGPPPGQVACDKLGGEWHWLAVYRPESGGLGQHLGAGQRTPGAGPRPPWSLLCPPQDVCSHAR